IHAFVVPRPGQAVDVAALQAFCRDKLADYKIPRRITFTETLPRGPMGKVLKSDLRRIAAERPPGRTEQ
uniref:AMP-binding enzyme n=1 Tax=Stenotrophomonas maltophilia TaxID=40324 RepID=UPI0013DBEAC8